MILESLTPTVAPAVEPATLAEAKTHLRVDHDADDALISGLIAAARAAIEAQASCTLVETTLAAAFDRFPCGEGGGYWYRRYRSPWSFRTPSAGSGPIELPRGPLRQVLGITYLDADGVERTLDPSVYRVVSGRRGRVEPKLDQAWPATAPLAGAVAITYTAGYATDAATLPPAAKPATLLLVGTLYEHRESVLVGTIAAELPAAVRDLIATFELPSIAY